jgi:hypothetical protein
MSLNSLVVFSSNDSIRQIKHVFFPFTKGVAIYLIELLVISTFFNAQDEI